MEILTRESFLECILEDCGDATNNYCELIPAILSESVLKTKVTETRQVIKFAQQVTEYTYTVLYTIIGCNLEADSPYLIPINLYNLDNGNLIKLSHSQNDETFYSVNKNLKLNGNKIVYSHPNINIPTFPNEDAVYDVIDRLNVELNLGTLI